MTQEKTYPAGVLKVARRVIDVEQASDEFLASTARLLESAATERARSGVPFTMAQPAFEQLSAALANIFEARRGIASFHAKSLKVAQQVSTGVSMWGPDSPCPAALETGNPVAKLVSAG